MILRRNDEDLSMPLAKVSTKARAGDAVYTERPAQRRDLEQALRGRGLELRAAGPNWYAVERSLASVAAAKPVRCSLASCGGVIRWGRCARCGNVGPAAEAEALGSGGGGARVMARETRPKRQRSERAVRRAVLRAVELRRAPKQSGHVYVDTSDNRPGRGAVERYVGRDRKGGPDLAAIDRVDADLALAELVDGRAALLRAHEMPTGTYAEESEMREARATAMGKIALAARMALDLAARVDAGTQRRMARRNK